MLIEILFEYPENQTNSLQQQHHKLGKDWANEGLKIHHHTQFFHHPPSFF